MKNIYRFALLGALFAAPAPALAQAGEQPPAEHPRGSHDRAGRGPMGGASIQRLLAQRTALGLSGDQVARLEQIGARLEASNAPLLEQVRAARPSGGQRPRDLTAEQRAEARKQMERLRPVMQQVRENQRAAVREARDVLTADQQQKLRETMRERRAESRQDRPRGRRPGGPGQPDAQAPGR